MISQYAEASNRPDIVKDGGSGGEAKLLRRRWWQRGADGRTRQPRCRGSGVTLFLLRHMISHENL
jgi:hypothetical protein